MQPILQPLYSLLQKENDFKWSKEHQQIFEQMKRTITHKLELTMPDTTKPFYIITDASNTSIGAALSQQHPTERKMKLVSMRYLSLNVYLFSLHNFLVDPLVGTSHRPDIIIKYISLPLLRSCLLMRYTLDFSIGARALSTEAQIEE